MKMNRFCRLSLSRLFPMALVATLSLASLPAEAQSRRPFCEEGRTASGECVDPDVVQAGRKDAILATQSKLSMTAPLVMPGDGDGGQYRYNQAETNAFFVHRLTRHGLSVPCVRACPP